MAKSRAFKIIGIVCISVVGLVLVTLVVVYLSLNSIVKKAIQGVGSDMTKTAVTVKSVSISPFSGSGRLKELAIGNPPGYKSADAFKFKELFVDLAVMSMFSSTKIIEEITIDSPEITFEGTLGESNIATINDNITAYGSSGAPAAPKDQPHESSTKMIMNRFVMKNAVVHIDASTPLGGGVTTLYLPEIVLTDIGRKSGGVTASEAASQIFAPIYESILRAVADPSKFLDKNVVNKILADPLKNLRKDVKEAPAKALDDLKKAPAKAVDDMKGQIKKKKKS